MNELVNKIINIYNDIALKLLNMLGESPDVRLNFQKKMDIYQEY